MKLKEIAWFVLGVIFIVAVIWFNVADKMYNYPNIWPTEREGLRILNRAMKDDKSERLGIAVITANQIYTAQSLDQNKVQLRAAFFEVPPPPPK